MTGAEQAVLSVLDGAVSDKSLWLLASHVGESLWGRPHRRQQHFARPAAKILRRLLSRGLVTVRMDSWCRCEWRITARGQAALRHPEAGS